MRLRAALVALLVLAGCARRSDEEKLLQAMGASKSWLATLPFVAEQRLGNRVPQAYARDCVESARKEIEKGTKAVEQSHAKRELKERLRRQLDVATESVSGLQRALDTLDRSAVERESARCASVHDQLDSLEKAYEGQP